MSILTPGQLQRIRKFEEGGAAGDQPYVAAVTRQDQFMDPLTQQLLYGTDGQGGFIPGAFRAAERTFFDEEGRPIVIPQEIAGLSPDQIQAQQLARGAVGVQQPFIQEAMSRGQQGIDALQSGIGGQALASQQALQQIQEGSRFALDQRDRAMTDAIGGTQQGRARAIEAEGRLRGDLSDITGMAQDSTGQYIDQLGQQAAQGRRATEDFGMDLAKVRQQGQRSYDEFGRDITDAVGMSMREREDLSRGLAGGENLAAQAVASQRGRLGLAEQGLKGGISELGRNLTDAIGTRMIGEQGLSRDLAQGSELAARAGASQRARLGLAEAGLQSGAGELGRNLTDTIGMRMMGQENLSRGLSRQEQLAAGAGASQRARLDLAEQGLSGGISRLDRDLTRQLGAEAQTTGDFSGQLGEARTQLRNTVEDGFSIGDKTSEYFDPYEDQVIQQSIRDASEGLAKQDMAQYARDISSGGESAFGSRARLSAEERAEAMGRGLAKEVGGIRSAGFQRAQQTAIGEDERARQAQRTASSGLASLAGQELTGERGLIDRAAQASQQRLGSAQSLAGMRQQRAASELGASRDLANTLGQTAQQRFGADQQVADAMAQASAQKFGAAQNIAGMRQQRAASELGSSRQMADILRQDAQTRFGAGQQTADALTQAAGQRFGAAQNLAGMRQQRAASELGSGTQLADIYRQGAQQRFGAGQQVAGQFQQAAGQKLAAGQGYGNLIQQTAQSQLGAQQQLGAQMGQQAQQQYGAQQGLGSLMSGAAQQRYGAATGLGQTLAGYGQQDAAARAAAAQQGMNVAGSLANQYGQIGQQQYGAGQALAGAQTGYGGFLSGLGGQAQQAAQQDVASLQGIGGQAQQQRQRELDAQRAGLLQAQQAPLAQYQALMPFVNMSPTGQTNVQTQYTPPPSAIQAGLGTGLAALGAIGNFNNPNNQLRQQPSS
jgi:hypothetical protein